MRKESVFSLKLESDLREQFIAEAAAVERPASQLVREFMRDFIRRQRDARAHDTWFRAEVELALRDADDPAVTPVPHDEVITNWRRKRATLLKRAGTRAE